MLALAPGIILTLADATIMTITVQAIIRQVGGSVVSVSWIMNGYNLVLTVLFLPMGRLGDRYGHKLVFTLGLALFTAASLPCALSTSIPELVAWRVVQAVGAAAVVPTALALLLQAFPERRQGFAAGLFGAVSSLALAVGPVLGGVLVWYRGWPAVFWFNLPVGIARRRPRAHAAREACARRARARPSTGPASDSSARGSSASRWRSSRATTGAGPRARSSGCSPAASPCSSSGSGGSSAPPLPCSTCACSATAPSPRPPAPS